MMDTCTHILPVSSVEERKCDIEYRVQIPSKRVNLSTPSLMFTNCWSEVGRTPVNKTLSVAPTVLQIPVCTGLYLYWLQVVT